MVTGMKAVFDSLFLLFPCQVLCSCEYWQSAKIPICCAYKAIYCFESVVTTSISCVN